MSAGAARAKRVLQAKRVLIVHADDFGLSSGVNAGIVRAHREGILTSASVLANAPAFAEAARLAGENPALGIGLHLNIVRGRPLSPPDAVPLLVDARGDFLPFRIRRMPPAFLAQAEREYRAQFEKLLAAARDNNLAVTHIDFEKHHAWQAPLYALAARLAEEYAVPGIRGLAEPVWFSLRKAGFSGWKPLATAAALRTAFAFGGGRVRTSLFRPDHFLGQLHIGRITERFLLRLLPALPAGTSELMTHPGLPDAPAPNMAASPGMAASWIAPHRESELHALTSPAVRKAAESAGIELRPYPH